MLRLSCFLPCPGLYVPNTNNWKIFIRVHCHAGIASIFVFITIDTRSFQSSQVKLKEYMRKLFDAIIEGMAFFTGVLLVLSMLSVSLDVVMRYFLNRPMHWVGELTEYALLYITFTGAAWVLRKDRHVKIDILHTVLSPSRVNILGLISSIIGAFVCAVLTYGGVRVTWDHIQRGIYEPTLLEFPKGAVLAIIPVGAFLLTIQFLRRFFTIMSELKER